VQALEEGDRPAPVGDLNPRVDVVAWRAVAGSEPAMVAHPHPESRVGEKASEALQPMFGTPAKPCAIVMAGCGPAPSGTKGQPRSVTRPSAANLASCRCMAPLVSRPKSRNIHDARFVPGGESALTLVRRGTGLRSLGGGCRKLPRGLPSFATRTGPARRCRAGGGVRGDESGGFGARNWRLLRVSAPSTTYGWSRAATRLRRPDAVLLREHSDQANGQLGS
jgi:hypothetical protein